MKSPNFVKLGSHDAWYVFVVRHVWVCQKDLSNLTHTVCFDVSIYRPIGEPEVTNERMTHLLKLDTFFYTHDARIMTHDASRIRTTHRVDLASQLVAPWKKSPTSFTTEKSKETSVMWLNGVLTGCATNSRLTSITTVIPDWQTKLWRRGWWEMQRRVTVGAEEGGKRGRKKWMKNGSHL